MILLTNKTNNRYIDTDYKIINKENISEEEIKKQKFFSISEVASLVGLPSSTIDFYSRKFNDILNVARPKVQRKYTKENIEQLKVIKSLLKDQKYAIPQVLEMLKKEPITCNTNYTPQSNTINANKTKVNQSEPNLNSAIFLQQLSSIITKEMKNIINDYHQNSIRQIKEEIIKNIIPELNLSILKSTEEINSVVEQNIKKTILGQENLNINQKNMMKNIPNLLEEHFNNISDKLDQQEKNFTERDIRTIEHIKKRMKEREKEAINLYNNKSWLYKLFHKNKY